MAGYYAELILSGKPAHKWDPVRDFDGTLWAALLYDTGAFLVVTLYRSTDSGTTWSSVRGADVYDTYFDLVVDGNGLVCLGARQWASAGGPTVRWYDEPSDTWQELAAGFQFVSTTAAVDCRFAVDTSRQPYQGINRFVCVFELVEASQWNVKYADVENQSASGIRVNAETENQHNPKIAIGANGVLHIAYRRAASQDARIVQRLETTPATFSAPVTVSAPGHVVTNLLDLRIHPQTELPAALYLRQNGGVQECWLTELDEDGTWQTSQVTDGVENPNFWPDRARLQIDARGSVVVAAVNDVPGGTPGTGEPHLWTLRRALGETVWAWHRLTPGGVGGTTAQPPAVLACRSTHQNGVFPIEVRQNVLAFPWVWPVGAGANDQALYYVNLDEYPGLGPYPTILSAVEGEPMYRPSIYELAEDELTSIELPGEGEAVETYPEAPDVVLDVTAEYPVHDCPFVLGYVGTVPKFVSGRRTWKVVQQALPESALASVMAFLEARIDDLAPFFLPDGDGGTKTVFLFNPESDQELVLKPTMRDVGVWSLEFFALETFA